MSSRVPAWGGGFSSKVPAYGAVWCQRTEPGGGWGKDCERTSHNRQTGHSKDFWDDDKVSETVMLLTEAFPIRGTSPASRGLLRPRVRHRNADRERSEKLSDRAKC